MRADVIACKSQKWYSLRGRGMGQFDKGGVSDSAEAAEIASAGGVTPGLRTYNQAMPRLYEFFPAMKVIMRTLHVDMESMMIRDKLYKEHGHEAWGEPKR